MLLDDNLGPNDDRPDAAHNGCINDDLGGCMDDDVMRTERIQRQTDDERPGDHDDR